MRIGFYQLKPLHGEKEKNLEIIKEVIRKSRAEILVFPELATSGYLVPDREFLEKNSFSVPDSREFEDLLKVVRSTGTVSVIGFPEKFNERFYNSALYILPDGSFGVYRKVHLFYKEKLYFEGGDSVESGIFEYGGFKFGVMICFDWFFPEQVRYLVLKGVNMILHCANLVLPWSQRAMRIYSVINRVFTLTSNRIGEERYKDDVYVFTGKSQIVSPSGKILARANSKSEVLRVKDLDLSESYNKNINEFNNIFEDLKRFYPYKELKDWK
ncbi:MAG: nitrilase-related carbon-nitrogen hydrolase [Candidatus Hydrothermales bacterium]